VRWLTLRGRVSVPRPAALSGSLFLKPPALPEDTLLLIPTIPPQKRVPFSPWTDIRQVNSLVKCLRDAAIDVAKVNASLLVYPAALESSRQVAVRKAAFAGVSLDWRNLMPEEPQLPRELRELPHHLRLCAEVLERSRNWYQVVYPRGVRLRELALLSLLELVKASTGRHHWTNLAVLLNASFDVAGFEANFTPKSLEEFYNDHSPFGRSKRDSAAQRTRRTQKGVVLR
jgi:hypothetical protein